MNFRALCTSWAARTPASYNSRCLCTGGLIPVRTCPGRDGAQKAYGSLIREGTAAQQEQLMNRRLQLSVWRVLRLPQHCRALWEAPFPELLAPDNVEA